MLFEPDEKKFSCPILGGGIGKKKKTYPNLFLARPILKKPTLLKLRGLFKYEDQSWRDIFPRFFSSRGFEAFQIREIARSEERRVGKECRV